MAIKSKAQLLEQLTTSAKRIRVVREAAEKERIATQFQEAEVSTKLPAALQSPSIIQGKA